MECYLAYFDILGFKEFLKNEQEYIDFRFDHLMRDSQSAISNNQHIKNSYGGLEANLNIAKANCLHISDSIIFWTNDKEPRDFLEIFKVAHSFLQCSNVFQTFPIRGCIVKGKITFTPFHIKSQHNASFINSSLYGDALVEAYIKAENQDWVGCYIDKSAATFNELPYIEDLLKNKNLFVYDVPLKDGTSSAEYTLPLVGDRANNIDEKGFRMLFEQHMQGKPLHASVEKKLANTLAFFNFAKQS